MGRHATIMANHGVTVKDVPAADFVVAYAAHLKRTGKLEVPKYVDLVKTSPYKELAPYDADWYYIRAASMARKIYIRGGVGVGAFRKMYGGRKNMGTCPEHYKKASGGIVRDILQGLEAMKILEKDGKGRKITQTGRRDLDTIAGQIAKH